MPPSVWLWLPLSRIVDDARSRYSIAHFLDPAPVAILRRSGFPLIRAEIRRRDGSRAPGESQARQGVERHTWVCNRSRGAAPAVERAAAPERAAGAELGGHAGLGDDPRPAGGADEPPLVGARPGDEQPARVRRPCRLADGIPEKTVRVGRAGAVRSASWSCGVAAPPARPPHRAPRQPPSVGRPRPLEHRPADGQADAQRRGLAREVQPRAGGGHEHELRSPWATSSAPPAAPGAVRAPHQRRRCRRRGPRSRRGASRRRAGSRGPGRHAGAIGATRVASRWSPAPVAGDLAQIGARAIGDPVAAGPVPPRIADRALGQAPGDGPAGIDGGQRLRPRRPRDICPRGDQLACVHAPRRRTDPWADTTHVPCALESRSLPGAGSDSAGAREMWGTDSARLMIRLTVAPAGENAMAPISDRRDRHHGDPAARARGRGGGPVAVGGAHRRPRAVLGAGLVGSPHAGQRSPGGRLEPVAHSRILLARCALSASSPRRRRELTVPRGRSSARAISPGVYSRT